MTTKPKIEVELEHCERQQLKWFLAELQKAHRGEIPISWIQNSFDALSPEVQALFLGKLPTG